MSQQVPPSASMNKGFLIAIVGGKGGVGKSVFAANFAVAMATDTKNGPLLLDMDPAGSGDLNLILGIKEVKAYGDAILQGKVRDSASIRSLVTGVAVGPQKSPLYALQMMSNPDSLWEQNIETLERALKQIKQSFPVTIVDCGSRIEGPVLSVLELATLVLVIANPDILVLNQTRRLVDKIQSAMVPPEMTKLIVNRFPQGTPYTPQFIEQSLRRQVLAVIPEDAASAAMALAKGAPFATLAPQSPATKALFSLSRTLIEKRVLESMVALNRPKRAKEIKLDNVDVTKKPGSPPSGERSRFGREPKDPRSVFKLRVHQQLVEKMDLKKEQLSRDMDSSQKIELRNKAMKVVVEVLNKEDHPWKSRDEVSKLTKEILDEALGLGPLEDLLADDSVTEIMVNRADLIYLEKGGKNIKSPVTFSSNQQLMQVIERIVNPIGRRIDEKTPYVDARLADGSRVHAIIPPLSLDGPMVTIRKFPKKRLGPEDLVKFGSMTSEMSDFLRACIEARMNILISGGTGSGKTTLLNVLSSHIPSSERILTVEDAAELQLQQEHVGRLETRPANIEGTGAVTIRDLVRQTLRMKPDRIIIGEVRQGEALDMLQAMNTGHDGSMATIHSNNPREALARLETLVMMAGMDLPAKSIREQIASAVNLIVQQTRLSDGSRKVTYITEITGMQGEVISSQDIFLFKQTGMDKDRKVVGKHVASGFIPKFIEKIEAIGIKIPRGLFKAA